VIDFRDEQGDGNDGEGMLSLSGTADDIIKHAIRGNKGYMWKTYGPFCAPEGYHNLSYVSDINPEETTFTIKDSYGLVKAQGGMSDFPATFHTIAPSKFCSPEGGLSDAVKIKRSRKLFAAHDQYMPRAELEKQGLAIPQDMHPPLSVWDNSGGQRSRESRRADAGGAA